MTSLRLTPTEFAAKWGGSTRNERAAAQEHFIDLCRMLGVPTPNDADPNGDWYAFEKGAEKTDGGEGFADVWKKHHFAWEYKGKRKDLATAYKQLLDYRENLENPPLLVVCDLERFEIHTNYTNTKKQTYTFTLTDLLRDPSEPLRLLKAVFSAPEDLRPNQTPEQVTQEAASKFAELAGRLQSRGHDPLEVAHFLNRLLFCLFAEDVGLLPRRLFSRLTESTLQNPSEFGKQLETIFSLMARSGGHFGLERIQWFNGGLFEDSKVLALNAEDLSTLGVAASLDWSSVEPSILGTLFERGLDPAKRGQLGAHYTDRESILRVIEPVVLVPLRREFEVMKSEVLALKAKTDAKRKPGKRSRAPLARPEVDRFKRFLHRLGKVVVLDPACGSGNFLYVALQKLKDLEREAILWGSGELGIPQLTPEVGPQNVRGIELSAYAAELAKTTIWIGQIQWMVSNGFSYPTNPVLQPLDQVECRDAVLDQRDPEHPRKAVWPDTEFIVGNPPFIGGKLMRESLGDAYVDALFEAWDGEVPREADFVCYWHEGARQHIEATRTRRAGLLATQGIRGGANQRVLKRIKETGDIFEAWQDEPWVVEGAAVRISIVCQDDGAEQHRRVDGQPAQAIHADLTPGSHGSADLTTARPLLENLGISFMGDTKGGPFDISGDLARGLLSRGGNPNGRPNSDVVVPWVNGLDVTRRPRDMFIIDFGVEMSERDAAMYEGPFAHVSQLVKPARAKNKRAAYAQRWWIHVEARPKLRQRLSALLRFLVTPTVARHRSFGWVQRPTLPDHQLIVFARDDDYFFGVVHSRVHEAWALHQGTQLEDRPRYTPSSTFETFPFPWPLDLPDAKLTPAQRVARDAIASAACALERRRSAWLNPPDLVRYEPDVSPTLPPRRLPRSDAAAKQLAKRTITQLYNQRPDWLKNLHADLDRAVLAAYGWPEGIADDDLLAGLLRLNHERAAAQDRQGRQS